MTRLARHVVIMGDARNAYRIFVRHPEESIPLQTLSQEY